VCVISVSYRSPVSSARHGPVSALAVAHRLGLDERLGNRFHVPADVKLEGLYVEVNTLAAPLVVGLLKGPTHIWHLRE